MLYFWTTPFCTDFSCFPFKARTGVEDNTMGRVLIPLDCKPRHELSINKYPFWSRYVRFGSKRRHFAMQSVSLRCPENRTKAELSVGCPPEADISALLRIERAHGRSAFELRPSAN